MEQTKYYYNPTDESLTVVSIADGAVSNIIVLDEPLTIDAVEEDEEEEEPEPQPKSKNKNLKGFEKFDAPRPRQNKKHDMAAIQADIEAGMSVADIAGKNNCSKQVVYNARSYLKTKGELPKKVSSTPGAPLANSAIKKIQKMRADGMTTSEIADEFNLPFDTIEKVKAVPFMKGAGDKTPEKKGSTGEQIANMFRNGASIEEVRDAFPDERIPFIISIKQSL